MSDEQTAVERVARALYEHPTDNPDWKGLAEPERAVWLHWARAAIEAMHEPPAAIFETNATDTPVDGRAASELLTNAGFPLQESTLTKLRCTGGGPKFLKYGSRVRYRPSALSAWVESRTRELAHNSDANEDAAGRA